MTDLGAFLGADDRTALDRPPGEAVGLPAACYGEDFFALEQRKLFPRHWCALAFGADVPGPGSAMPVDFAGWPLLVVRDREGAVRVFHNVCPHRANRLVAEPCSGLRRITCPWHVWTFHLDGRLAATPRVGGESLEDATGFDATGLALREVRSAMWHDLIFINLDGKAPPLAEHLAPVDALVAGYGLDGLDAGEPWRIACACNWKIGVEAAIEDYHLPCIHPGLVAGVQRYNPRLDHAPGVYYANATARDSDGGYGDLSAEDNWLPAILEPGAEPMTRVVNLFPTGFAVVHPHFLWLFVLRPDGARHTTFVNREYVRDDGRGGMERHRAGLTALLRRTLGEDGDTMARVQANMEGPGAADVRTRFSPFWEANVPRFQQAVIASLEATA